MNYNILFPKLERNLPEIKPFDLCYNYNPKKVNHSTNDYAYMPTGRKAILWLTMFEGKYYGVMMQVSFKNSELIVNRTTFDYFSFKKELTIGCGTMFWATRIGNELCLNKVIYYMGEKKNIYSVENNLSLIATILECYLKNIPNSPFIQLKLPYVDTNKYPLNNILNVNYRVYNILNMRTNYSINMSRYLLNFAVKCIDSKSDIYELYYYDKKARRYNKYTSAFINSLNTQRLMLNTFNLENNDRQIYQSNFTNEAVRSDIEVVKFSNDIVENNDESCEVEDAFVNMLCLYYIKTKRWIPYSRSNETRVCSKKDIDELIFTKSKKC